MTWDTCRSVVLCRRSGGERVVDMTVRAEVRTLLSFPDEGPDDWYQTIPFPTGLWIQCLLCDGWEHFGLSELEALRLLSLHGIGHVMLGMGLRLKEK